MGFVLGPAAVVAGINKLQSHATSNPNSITQKAAIEALNGPQDSVAAMLAEYRRRRDYVMERLRKMPGVKTQTPQGRVLRVSQRKRGVPRRHHQCASILRKAAGRRVCRAGAGRGLRNQRTHPHLLRDLDEGVGARSGPAARGSSRPGRKCTSAPAAAVPRKGLGLGRGWSRGFESTGAKIGEVWFEGTGDSARCW